MPARLVGPLAERAHHDFTVHMAAHVMTGMRELRGDRLEDWMRSVEPDDLPALHSFLTGIRRDQDAVVAGLTLSWAP